MSANDLNDLTLALDTPTEAVDTLLREEGLCILPGFLSQQSVQGIRSDFEGLFQSVGAKGIKVHQKTAIATSLAVDWDRVDRSAYRGLAQQLDDGPMRRATDAYFGEESIFPQKIFAVRTLPSAEPVNRLPFLPHTDRLHMLKFILYLTDVSAESGATRIITGSHNQRKSARRNWLASGKHQRAFKNILPVPIEDMTPVEGVAGTLLILDTDVPHASGQVHAGHIREIIRIDTMNLHEAYGPLGQPRSDTVLSRVYGALAAARASFFHARHRRAS